MTEDEQSGPLAFDDSDEPADPVEPPLDDTAAGHPPPPPPRPTVDTQKYTWFVGVVAIIVLVYIGVNTLHNGPGAHGVPAGDRVPPFATPLAPDGPKGDANIFAGSNHGKNRPACSVHLAGVFNVCDAYARRALVLVFFVTRGDCTGELDAVAHVASRFPSVEVVGVAIRGSRDTLNKLVIKHGWKFPVAFDHDGALANAYGVVVCPQITYVRRGGISAGTDFRARTEAELAVRFAALQAGRVLPK